MKLNGERRLLIQIDEYRENSIDEDELERRRRHEEMNLKFRDSNFITYKIFYNSKYFVIYLFEIKTKNIDMYNRCRVIVDIISYRNSKRNVLQELK